MTVASRPIAFRGDIKLHFFSITGFKPTGQPLNDKLIK